jgi:hypothetical protein
LSGAGGLRVVCAGIDGADDATEDEEEGKSIGRDEAEEE